MATTEDKPKLFAPIEFYNNKNYKCIDEDDEVKEISPPRERKIFPYTQKLVKERPHPLTKDTTTVLLAFPNNSKDLFANTLCLDASTTQGGNLEYPERKNLQVVAPQ
jgi:hypothetical protein